MSNSKNAIQEIKNLMVQFGFMSDEPVMASFKTEDNTILETLKLQVGSKITKINDEFKRVALETGKYRLVENFEIEVKDGLIKKVKQIFLDAKLADGTVIKVEGDSLAEGAKVIVVTEDAEIPAPDGVHELEDGTKVETKDGIIAKFEEMEEKMGEHGDKEKKRMKDVEVGVEVPAEIAPVAEEVVESIIEALMPLMEEVKVLVEEMKKMKDYMKDMKNDFDAFKKEPASKPIANGKTDFNKQFKNDDLDSKIEMIKSLRNNK